MNLTAVIVDDEPLAREHLRGLIADERDIDVLAECANGPEALVALRARAPDLLLLDVQMPEMDGFELLRKLKPPLPLVIFVTAFDQHAISAFDVHAVDYVLKPVGAVRFRRALQHVRALLAAHENASASRRLVELLEQHSKKTDYLSRLMVRNGGRTRFVHVADIDWVEAANNYVVIHTGKQTHILRETLAAVEAQLSPREFFRLSRSALVRLDRVREVEPVFDDEHVIVLHDGTRLPLTRSLRELQDRLRFG
jgi:two-component system LytT family response regulator